MAADGSQQDQRVAFLGANNWKAHEALRWWSAAYGQGARFKAESQVAHVDVFGVGRPDVSAAQQRSLLFQGLRPVSYDRIASSPDVGTVVCSGQGPDDVQVVKQSRQVGKAVFVESLERFQPGDLAELAAAGQEQGQPLLMAGLYLRFDSVMREAAELGIDSMVGRPLLYQAHASTVSPSLIGRESGGLVWFSQHRNYPVTPSLYELGLQQVDALRFLLNTEVTEVYAAGSGAQAGAEADDAADAAHFNSHQAVSLTLKTSSGMLAVVTLDASGGAARQRIMVVGDQSRTHFGANKDAATDLQMAGINHFMDVVTAGAPPHISPTDCLHTAAVMLAAAQSLRSGHPVPVSYDFSAASSTATHGTAGTAVDAAATTPKAAVPSLAGAAADLVSSAAGMVKAGVPAAKGRMGTDSAHWSPAGKPGSGAGGRRAGMEEEEGVSTPPHQGTPGPKAIGTPESPPLLTNLPSETD